MNDDEFHTSKTELLQGKLRSDDLAKICPLLPLISKQERLASFKVPSRSSNSKALFGDCVEKYIFQV